MDLVISLAHGKVIAQLKWIVRFTFLADPKQRKIFLFYLSKCITQFLSYIEIWENVGDLTNPNYQGTILNTSDDYQFDNYWDGEIIRINRDQCNTLIP